MTLLRRLRETLVERAHIRREPKVGAVSCPCCGFLTLPARGQFELCPVCLWEDDGQDDYDADVARGGPNGPLSLAQARANYAALGACDLAFLDKVRLPTPEERRTAT